MAAPTTATHYQDDALHKNCAPCDDMQFYPQRHRDLMAVTICPQARLIAGTAGLQRSDCRCAPSRGGLFLLCGISLTRPPTACATGSTCVSRWYDSEIPNSKRFIDLMGTNVADHFCIPLTLSLVGWLAGQNAFVVKMAADDGRAKASRGRVGF